MVWFVKLRPEQLQNIIAERNVSEHLLLYTLRCTILFLHFCYACDFFRAWEKKHAYDCSDEGNAVSIKNKCCQQVAHKANWNGK